MIVKISHVYLIIFTAINVFAHFLGANGVSILDLSRETHIIFLIISLALFIGLFYKSMWAYWLGFCFYILRIFEYPFQAYLYLVKEKKIDWSYLLDWLMMMGVIVSIIILIRNKKFLQKRKVAAKN